MQSNNIASLKKYSSEKDAQRFEVIVDQQNDAPLISLKKSVWVEGLGWSVQKTIQLNHNQLEELSRAIIVAKHHLARRSNQQGEAGSGKGKIIKMPLFITPASCSDDTII